MNPCTSWWREAGSASRIQIFSSILAQRSEQASSEQWYKEGQGEESSDRKSPSPTRRWNKNIFKAKSLYTARMTSVRNNNCLSIVKIGQKSTIYQQTNKDL